MTSTPNPQVKVTKGEDRYDGTPQYDVTVDGRLVGRVRQTVSRSAQMSGRIAVGYTQRNVWKAGTENYGYSTRAKAVAALVARSTKEI